MMESPDTDTSGATVTLQPPLSPQLLYQKSRLFGHQLKSRVLKRLKGHFLTAHSAVRARELETKLAVAQHEITALSAKVHELVDENLELKRFVVVAGEHGGGGGGGGVRLKHWVAHKSSHVAAISMREWMVVGYLVVGLGETVSPVTSAPAAAVRSNGSPAVAAKMSAVATNATGGIWAV
ncbi:hypothetical protein HDU98_010928 [Podochytrium sp. JEL0797]|nr:hypothetical protein HDU98_010928 [Podochytrium sp. JEL0797]